MGVDQDPSDVQAAITFLDSVGASLLTPEKKLAYDHHLRASLSRPIVAPPAVGPPAVSPVPNQAPGRVLPNGTVVGEIAAAPAMRPKRAASVVVKTQGPVTGRSGKRKKKKSRLPLLFVLFILSPALVAAGLYLRRPNRESNQPLAKLEPQPGIKSQPTPSRDSRNPTVPETSTITTRVEAQSISPQPALVVPKAASQISIQADANPFIDLIDFFELPEQPLGGRSKSIDLGRLGLESNAEISLSLDCTAVALPQGYTFQAYEEANDDDERHWSVVASKSDGGWLSTSPHLANFYIDNEAHLHFQWDLERPYAAARQLANAHIVLQKGSARHAVQMRETVRAMRHPIQLIRNKAALKLDIAEVPNPDSLFVEVRPFNLSIESPSAASSKSAMPWVEIPLGEERTLFIDSGERVELLGNFDVDDTKQVGLGIIAKAPRKEGAKRTSLLMTEIQKEINKQELVSRRYVNDYVIAANTIPVALSKIKTMTEERAKLQRKATGSPRTAALLLREISSLAQGVAAQEAQVGKSKNTIQRLQRQIPTAYQSLGYKLSIGRAIDQIHTRGELEFRFAARTEAGRIDLVAGSTPALREHSQATIPLMDLQGNWFAMRGVGYSRYKISNGAPSFALGGNPKDVGSVNQGSFARYDGTRESPVVSGSWHRQGNAITFSATGGSESYELSGELILKNGRGTWMFRLRD